ncbi:hypothetical protein L210DRAFT_3592098 [Boletus edulis BED1]|uniref:Uncharacterized protein n=1 Tax=Boletus edulis BED1 TaxID=1328754 RepID=A0AAD4G4B9_BOLED|nr:hypothetical protein L210DRAFT_3592098 [Boletus edulis BED1]
MWTIRPMAGHELDKSECQQRNSFTTALDRLQAVALGWPSVNQRQFRIPTNVTQLSKSSHWLTPPLRDVEKDPPQSEGFRATVYPFS